MFRHYIQSSDHSQTWFTLIRNISGKTNNQLALSIGVSPRTIRDWQKAKFGISEESFSILEKIAAYPFNDVRVQDSNEIKFISARKGGLSRIKQGPIGDTQTRRKGGMASMQSHYQRGTGLFQVKKCQSIPYSVEAAELVGVIIGDGHLSQGQIEVTLDMREREYGVYLCSLFKRVTGFEANIRARTTTYFSVSLSGIEISNEIGNLGVEYGNKTIRQSHIPHWISENLEYSKAFIKALFDTDGCLYIDKHCINGIWYQNLGIALTAYNVHFLDELRAKLLLLGLHPTTTTKHQLRLRRGYEIHKFISMIKPVNKKHLVHYQV